MVLLSHFLILLTDMFWKVLLHFVSNLMTKHFQKSYLCRFHSWNYRSHWKHSFWYSVNSKGYHYWRVHTIFVMFPIYEWVYDISFSLSQVTCSNPIHPHNVVVNFTCHYHAEPLTFIQVKSNHELQLSGMSKDGSIINFKRRWIVEL